MPKRKRPKEYHIPIDIVEAKEKAEKAIKKAIKKAPKKVVKKKK